MAAARQSFDSHGHQELRIEELAVLISMRFIPET